MRGHQRSKLPAGVKASKFMSEAELEANKAVHGERLEDGTFAGRTLREALAANKAEKEQKFQDGWKQMKQGAWAYMLCTAACGWAVPVAEATPGRRQEQTFGRGRAGVYSEAGRRGGEQAAGNTRHRGGRSQKV